MENVENCLKLVRAASSKMLLRTATKCENERRYDFSRSLAVCLSVYINKWCTPTAQIFIGQYTFWGRVFSVALDWIFHHHFSERHWEKEQTAEHGKITLRRFSRRNSSLFTNDSLFFRLRRSAAFPALFFALHIWMYISLSVLFSRTYIIYKRMIWIWVHVYFMSLW